MKVLQINCVFRKGSTGKITNDLHAYYKAEGVDSYVIYGRGAKILEKNVYKVASEFGSKLRNLFSRYTGNLYGMGKGGLRRTIVLLKRIQPDIVHLQCINGYFIDVYGLLEYLKKKNIPTLLTLHAEFMHTGNCGYAFDCEEWKTGCRQCPDVRGAIASINSKATKRNWAKMKKAFEFFYNLRVVGVSDWVSNRAKLSPILKDKEIVTVFNGLDDEVFCRRLEPLLEVSTICEIGKKILLFVTPYFEDENKGGKWILHLAKKMKDEPIVFVVIGKTDKRHAYDNIKFIGGISDPVQLAQWYSQADLTLLLSKKETFSMVCAESLCCGTPIIGFQAGAPEGIALKDFSSFVPYGDIEALVEQIQIWLRKKVDKENISNIARGTYSKKAMGENYLKQYIELLEGNLGYGKN